MTTTRRGGSGMASVAILPQRRRAATIRKVEPWEPPLDKHDVEAILKGLFDANVRLLDVAENVVAIRRLLEEDEQEEEDWPEP